MAKLTFLVRKFTFVFHDVQEISSSAYSAFVSTFHYNSEESESDSSDFDPDTFGCDEITPEVENMVENTWEICHPLGEVYDGTTSALIKETVVSATKETQCAGLNFFKNIAQGENRNLILTYTTVCGTVKKLSPIIAEATINLLGDL